ncbi:chaperonin 10-like protein [Thamnidium elegans]|nr:chaperonin 10-like protein [Thamnidium elegans]
MVVKKSEIDPDADIPQGVILIKNLVLSVDPYMRTRIRGPDVPSYLPAFDTNEIMPGFIVGQILKSNNAKFTVGDTVYGMVGFAIYLITPEPLTISLDVHNEIKSSGLPITSYVSVLGMPSIAAYVGSSGDIKYRENTPEALIDIFYDNIKYDKDVVEGTDRSPEALAYVLSVQYGGDQLTTELSSTLRSIRFITETLDNRMKETWW